MSTQRLEKRHAGTAFLVGTIFLVGSLGVVRLTDSTPSLQREAAQAPSRGPLEVSTGQARTSPSIQRREALVHGDAQPEQSDAAFRVAVLLADGQPAPGLMLTYLHGGRHEIARATTDLQGRATFPLRDVGAHEGGVLQAEILGSSPLEHAVATFAEDIELRLPPTGAVRFVVRDATGAPAGHPCRLGVWGNEPDGTEVELPLWLPAPDGTARLAYVGLGLDVRVLATTPDGAFPDVWAEARGPEYGGEEVTIDLVLENAWPTVTLRAIDEEGNALANAEIQAELRWTAPPNANRWAAGQSVPSTTTTDAEGAATFTVSGSVEGGYGRTLVLQDAATSRSAQIDLSWELRSGETVDLGPVLFTTETPAATDAVWIAGHVVDAGGTPISGVEVVVSISNEEAAHRARASSDEHGAFRILGAPTGGATRVRAFAPGYHTGTWEHVLVGSSDLRLELRPARCWKGRLLLDDEIAPDAFVVHLRSNDGTHQRRVTSDTIAIDGIGDGPIDVEVRTHQGGWLVHRWDGLVATSDGSPHALDLRGRVQPIDLRLNDAEGTPLDRTFVRVTPLPHDEAGVWSTKGTVRLFVPADTTSLRLRPAGFEPREAAVTSRVQQLFCAAIGTLGTPSGTQR